KILTSPGLRCQPPQSLSGFVKILFRGLLTFSHVRRAQHASPALCCAVASRCARENPWRRESPFARHDTRSRQIAMVLSNRRSSSSLPPQGREAMTGISITSNDGALDSASAILWVKATNPAYNQPALRIDQASDRGGAASIKIF